MSGLLDTLSVDRERMRAAADEGYTTATAVADALVRRGIPFRVAHHVVGVARRAGRGGRARGSTRCPDPMIGLALGAAARSDRAVLAEDPTIGEVLRGAASVDGALATCDVLGGTAPTRVAEALAVARARLGGGWIGSRLPSGRAPVNGPRRSRRCSVAVRAVRADVVTRTSLADIPVGVPHVRTGQVGALSRPRRGGRSGGPCRRGSPR